MAQNVTTKLVTRHGMQFRLTAQQYKAWSLGGAKTKRETIKYESLDGRFTVTPDRINGDWIITDTQRAPSRCDWTTRTSGEAFEEIADTLASEGSR